MRSPRTTQNNRAVVTGAHAGLPDAAQMSVVEECPRITRASRY
jgi:hypothetical protein